MLQHPRHLQAERLLTLETNDIGPILLVQTRRYRARDAKTHGNNLPSLDGFGFMAGDDSSQLERSQFPG
jgi:hypothetical protein